MMIQLVDYCFELVAKRDEVDHVLVFIQWTFHIDSQAIVMPVQPLAHIAVEGNEMRGAEDVLLFVQADAVGHRFYHRHGGASSPSRRPANSAAATRSAVVPGLR